MSYVDPSKISVCKIQSFETVHHVKIIGYSRTKNFLDTYIEAGKFDLAGHTWAVQYGRTVKYDGCRETGYIRLSLALVTEPEVPVAAYCTFSLLSQDGAYSPKKTEALERLLTKRGHACCSNFMGTSKIEYYLKNDSLLVQCYLQVEKPSCTEETKKPNIAVPPPDMNQHLGCLLESKEGADVTFHLNGEAFVAHKVVLAARSPVFRAQFFGPMMESKTDSVKIEEMNPEVFKAMLHFIYTEALPPGEDVSFEMAQHLLVAADRYELERLKVICAELLCKGIDAKTVATTLALAVRHSCGPLKDFCVDFVASRQILDTVMASDEFENLVSSCPCVMKDIIEKVKKVYV